MADQGSFLKPTFRRVFLLANRPILEGSDSLAEVFQRAGLDIKVLGYMSGPPQRATSFRTSVAGPLFFPLAHCHAAQNFCFFSPGTRMRAEVRRRDPDLAVYWWTRQATPAAGLGLDLQLSST